MTQLQQITFTSVILRHQVTREGGENGKQTIKTMLIITLMQTFFYFMRVGWVSVDQSAINLTGLLQSMAVIWQYYNVLKPLTSMGYLRSCQSLKLVRKTTDKLTLSGRLSPGRRTVIIFLPSRPWWTHITWHQESR